MQAPENPPSNDVTDAPPIYTDEDARALFPAPPGVPPQHTPLPLPLAIPQVAPDYDQPYFRGYNETLVQSGIAMGDWLRFLDALNIAMSGSPPLRVVGLAGTIVGFVPNHWAQLAGFIMTTGAKVGNKIVTKSLTDRLLQTSNQDYFQPRGLVVRICTTGALRQLVGMGTKPQPSKWKAAGKKAGHTVESVASHLPVTGLIVRRAVDLFGHKSPEVNRDSSPFQRRTVAFEGYIMPLFTDVPPPMKPEDWLNKMSNVVTKINLWKASRKEQRAGDPGHQLALAEGTAITPSRGSSHGGREARGLGGLIRGRMDRRDQMIASRAQRNPIAMERLRSDVRYQDRVQERKNEDVLWVVVLNEEQDRHISVNLPAHVPEAEQIQAAEFDAEIRKEIEQEEAEVDADLRFIDVSDHAGRTGHR